MGVIDPCTQQFFKLKMVLVLLNMLLQASAADAYSSLVKDGIDLKSFTSDSARSHSGRLNLRLRCVVSARIPVLSNFANS
ncbi:Protein of unknown function [Gryllus bimaculatus]|nr:Protein of unknown function [Gryllus bimaculatus]